MMIHRALAVAVTAALVASPAFAAESDMDRGDTYTASVMSDTQVRCYDLMSQFDKSVAGMKSTAKVKAAKAMRIKGERQCGDEEDLDIVKKGAMTLEHALTNIGQKRNA